MPLFLCNLAPLLGKDEDTLARWCERGGVVPGAYRTRGGSTRRGKWRVAVPRAHKADVATAQVRWRRDAIPFADYVAILTLDRLCNRIAENAQGFSRRRKRPQLPTEITCPENFKVTALDVARFQRDYATRATALIAKRTKPMRALIQAALRGVKLQARGKQGHNLKSFGAVVDADPIYGLALALAADAYRRGDSDGASLTGLAMHFGMTLDQLRQHPALEDKLRRAHHAAKTRSDIAATAKAPDIDAPEQKDLHFHHGPMRAGDEEREKRARSASAQETAAESAQNERIGEWLGTLSSDELANAAKLLPAARRLIEKRRAAATSA